MWADSSPPPPSLFRIKDKYPPSRAAPANPRPQAKAWMQKPQGEGKFLVQILGGVRRNGMDEIDTCIRFSLTFLNWFLVRKDV